MDEAQYALKTYSEGGVEVRTVPARIKSRPAEHISSSQSKGTRGSAIVYGKPVSLSTQYVILSTPSVICPTWRW